MKIYCHTVIIANEINFEIKIGYRKAAQHGFINQLNYKKTKS